MAEPWAYVPFTSKQLSKWQRVHAQLSGTLAGASGFMWLVAQSTAVVTERVHGSVLQAFLFHSSLNADDPDRVTHPYLLGLLACSC